MFVKTQQYYTTIDRGVEIKEIKKMVKYLDLAREQEKLWNMKVMVMPIVGDAFGMVPKGLEAGQEELEIRRRIKNIQTTALLRIAGILRSVLETWGDLLSFGLLWKTTGISQWEKLTRGKIINSVWFYV